MCQCSSRLSQKRRLASSVRNAARQALFFLRFSLFKSPGLCCHRIDRDRCCRMPSDDDLSRSPPHEESHWMPVSVRSEIISSVLAEQSCSLNMSQPYLGQTPMPARHAETWPRSPGSGQNAGGTGPQKSIISSCAVKSTLWQPGTARVHGQVRDHNQLSAQAGHELETTLSRAISRKTQSVSSGFASARSE